MLTSHEHEIAALKMARSARDKKAIASLELKTTPPEITDGMMLYVYAYIALDTEREPLEPIPWSKITDYCHEYGLDVRQTDDMHDYIRAADNEVRKQRAKDANRNAT